MRIDINQQKIAVGEKYKIFIDGKQTHYASKKIFSRTISLFENNAMEIMTINPGSFWFKLKYDIQLCNGNNIEVRTKSFWKSHYQCQNDSDLYDIYAHYGTLYSVYKNDEQIACWKKESVTWFEGDNYTIFANRNCLYELVISFCLIIDDYENKDSNSTVSIDLGRIGPQAKEFNPDWRPSNKK